MFRRLLIEDWTAIFTVVAFVTALSVYVTIFYRTVRMRQTRADELAHIPFDDETTTTSSSHE